MSFTPNYSDHLQAILSHKQCVVISFVIPDRFFAQGVIERALILQAITPCAKKRSGITRLAWFVYKKFLDIF